MAQLRESDFRAVLDFVGEAYDAQDRDEFRAAILPGFRRLVPSTYASYNELAGTTPVATLAEPELPGWAMPAWERHAPENPLLRRYLRTRDGRAIRFSDVAPTRELRRLPIFEHFYLPLGIQHQVAFVLPSTPQLTIAVVLSRGGRDFGGRDLKLLELARPHLIQAYRAAELRERLVATIGGLRVGLDADGTAMVLLDGDGTTSFASDAARELLGRAGDEQLREGRPPGGPLGDWARAGQGSGSIEIEGGDALLVRRIRSDHGTVLVLDRADRALSLEALRLLGLTEREAVVLHGLARGHSTEALATDLAISPRTVAKHVQRINAKLGVRNRAQAIATAWAAAGG
ncbi:MAG TPA: LuxR C-terminal-related transcriptional regulator [Solirubrobacterales bacterium]|nr:LuxR C-terminal-related transcriptional regulator [Solirubrobacterales bacterium]